MKHIGFGKVRNIQLYTTQASIDSPKMLLVLAALIHSKAFGIQPSIWLAKGNGTNWIVLSVKFGGEVINFFLSFAIKLVQEVRSVHNQRMLHLQLT